MFMYIRRSEYGHTDTENPTKDGPDNRRRSRMYVNCTTHQCRFETKPVT